ncbi:MAG: urea ABC transporter ATP-binding subunit UrtE [Nitrospirales bacterium]|nr:urea ABC transporter ATP-binding subunit UrtE [Nitrospirales bacterium]
MIQLDNVNVYYGESHILRNVSFEIPEGQALCLMGRNGVGKTTLLKTIMGLLSPRTGRVSFGGQDITRETPERRVDRGIAYVPQGREIFPYLTVEENLRLGYESSGSPWRAGLGRSVFEEVFELFPKLPQVLGRAGGVLSGGEQQQLAIGRALLGKPRLLLLDEPTEGIQPSIVMEIQRVIQSFKNQRRFAILLVEQYMEFAATLADTYIIMSKGSIVSAGQTSELSEEHVKQYLIV